MHCISGYSRSYSDIGFMMESEHLSLEVDSVLYDTQEMLMHYYYSWSLGVKSLFTLFWNIFSF